MLKNTKKQKLKLFILKFTDKKMKYKDSDIINSVMMHLNYESQVYGANGHFSVGAYYDMFEGYKDAEKTQAASQYKTNDGTLDEYLQAAIWMKNF